MKTRILMFTVLAVLLVAGCKGTREGIKQDYKTTKDDVSDAFSKSPEEVQKEKVKLNSKIEAEQYKIESEIKSIKGRDFSERDQNNATYTLNELEQLLDTLKNSSESIAHASDESWDDVKDQVQDSLDDVEDRREGLVKNLYADLD